MTRKLLLRKEALAELSSDELRQVAGAAMWTPWCPFFIELQEKLSDAGTC